jgi:hypothetical protein
MDFSEIFENVTNSLDRMRDAMVFLLRTYTKTVIAISLILFVGTVWWGRNGFSFDFLRSSASLNDLCNTDLDCGGGEVCREQASAKVCVPANPGNGTSPTPTSTAANTKVNPHSYCDYATNSCTSKATEDWSAPECGAAGACVPGNCRLWTGSGTTWSPIGAPANVPACEPLSQIPGTVIPNYVGGVLNPARTGFPDCFIANTYSSQDPNFGTFAGATGDTVPVVLKDNPNAKLFYKAFVVNNCPWKVHMVLQTDGSFKASSDLGAGKRDRALADGFTTFNMPNGFDIPSCWNSGGAMPKDCAREVLVNFDLKAFTCGSVGLQIEWVHLTTPGGGTAGGIKDPQGAGTATSLNYGKDCTGSATERAPGGPAGGGGGTGGTACTTAPKAPQLMVQCGATQNVLTWTRETNACANSVLRSIDSGNASFISDASITATSTTYTDKNIQAGHSYTYRVKNNPSVTSNAVTCKDGVLIGSSPAPTVAVTPRVTIASTPAPTLVVRTPSPTISGSVPTPTLIASVPTPTPSFVGSTPGVTIIAGVPTPVPGGTAGGVGTVQTGPGEATLLAFIVSAVISLAYVSYTYSPSGRRNEAEEVAKDQGPMDFRS